MLERSPARNMKTLARSPAKSRKPSNTRSIRSFVRRSRRFGRSLQPMAFTPLLAHLKRIFGLNRLRLHGPTTQMASYSSPQPPKTAGSWPRLLLRRRHREKSDRKGACAVTSPMFSAFATLCFSTESAENRSSLHTACSSPCPATGAGAVHAR